MFDIHSLDDSEAKQYERFTFQRERAGLAEKCRDEQAVVLAASWLSEPVGLIVARAVTEAQEGEIDSLFVGEGFRSGGLGSGLLLSAGERLREKGCQFATISFSASQKDAPALRRVLTKCGWEEPVKSHEIAKYSYESFSWVNRVDFYGSDKAIPWAEPAPEVLEQVKRGADQWYPRRVSPFNSTAAGSPDPATSFWFRADGEISGWLVTSRVAEDTLNFDTFYVREELQGTGRAMPFFAKVIKMQFELGLRYGCHLVNYRQELANPYLLRFHEKHLKPGNVALSEYYQARKTW